MSKDKGGIVRIEDCIIFRKLNESYLLSLGYFRTLTMLDQCHDFCESGGRNKWVSGKKFSKDDIVDSIMKLYKTDMQFIFDSFATLEPQQVDKFKSLVNTMTDPKIRSNLKSTHNIRDNILKGGAKGEGINLESFIGITSANLYDYVTEFKCSTFSKYLISILSEGKNIKEGIILGVDATGNNASYSSVYTNICDVVSNPDIKIGVLKSPATDYDAAGSQGPTNFIVNMVTKAKKTPILIGKLNPFENTFYRVQVTAKDVPFIDFTYYINKAIDDNYITLYVNQFFSQTQKNGEIPKPSGITKINSKKIGKNNSQNSVAYLTGNFVPSDNIYLFKTLGDVGQALSYKLESQKYPNLTNLYLTFDYLSALISSLFNIGTLLEDVGNAISPLSIFTFSQEELEEIKLKGANIEDIGAAKELLGLKRLRSFSNFGKNKLTISTPEIIKRLRIVKIRVTKDTKSGRKYLTRKELENKALNFKSLQLKAKKMGIKIMYNSKNGKKYKSEKRLLNETKSGSRNRIGTIIAANHIARNKEKPKKLSAYSVTKNNFG